MLNLFSCIRFSLQASDNIFLPVLFQRHGKKLSHSWPSILHMLRYGCWLPCAGPHFCVFVMWGKQYVRRSKKVAG